MSSYDYKITNSNGSDLAADLNSDTDTLDSANVVRGDNKTTKNSQREESLATGVRILRMSLLCVGFLGLRYSD